VLHFVASVLICSGILMLIDAGLTLAWQEPVSAFIAARQQDSLGHMLDDAPAFLAPEKKATAKLRDPRKRLRRLAAVWRAHMQTGDAVGRIILPTLHRKYVVVQGTNTTSLRKGPGHYPKTAMPGQGGTVAIAGHRTTYLAPFRTINQLKPGQVIVLDMPYAVVNYEVERIQIVKPTALWITNRVPGAERLVLSACHPLYSASHRIIAFARLKSVELK
jgi:sortase A